MDALDPLPVVFRLLCRLLTYQSELPSPSLSSTISFASSIPLPSISHHLKTNRLFVEVDYVLLCLQHCLQRSLQHFQSLEATLDVVVSCISTYDMHPDAYSGAETTGAAKMAGDEPDRAKSKLSNASVVESAGRRQGHHFNENKGDAPPLNQFPKSDTRQLGGYIKSTPTPTQQSLIV